MTTDHAFPTGLISPGAGLLVALLLAVSAPSAQSASNPADNLRIVPVDDPAVVGVRRDPVSGGAKEEAVGETAGGRVAWGTDYAAARAQAAREKKLVLLNFTGSDWCSWCRRLETDVFAQPEFNAYAATHFVLVKVDFPSKIRLPAAEVAQNASLQRQFAVTGYPTNVVVDAAGVKVAEIQGYVRGGPKAFLAAVEKQLRR